MHFLRHQIPIRGRPCRNRPNRDYRPIAEILSCLRLIRIQTCPAYRSRRTRFGRIGSGSTLGMLPDAIRHSPEYIPGWRVHHCGTTKNFPRPNKGLQLSSCRHVRNLRCYLHSSFRHLREGKTLRSKPEQSHRHATPNNEWIMVLAKSAPDLMQHLPDFQRRHTSLFCSAESPNRLPCFINTTFENSFIPDGVASTV